MIIAQKPMFIGGRNYKINEEIPGALILASRITPLENSGMIKVIQSVESKTETKKIYNPKKLSTLKKEELIKIAQENNIDPNGLSNKEIINAITGETGR